MSFRSVPSLARVRCAVAELLGEMNDKRRASCADGQGFLITLSEFWTTIGSKICKKEAKPVYFWMHLEGTTVNLASGANLRIREDGNG